MTIHLRGDMTRTAGPGDIITVTGIYLPQPSHGFRAIRVGLLTTTYLDAHVRE